MGNTWHDRLWIDLKALFTIRILKKFIAQRANYSVLFTGTANLIVPLPEETGLSSLSILRPEEITVYSKIQQTILNTLINSLEDMSDRDKVDVWEDCIRVLADLVRNNESKSELMNIVITHIFIAMLYSRKVTSNSCQDYCYVISNYIQRLSFNPEMQIFYAGFLLNKNVIIDVLSEQLLGVVDESKKSAIGTYLNVYFNRERDEIIEAIWNKSFVQKENDNLLIQAVQWYFIDTSVFFLLIHRKLREQEE